MDELGELQKRLKEIINKEKTYKETLSIENLSSKAVVAISSDSSSPRSGFFTIFIPDDSKERGLKENIDYYQNRFEYEKEKSSWSNWIDTFCPVERQLFDQVARELLSDRGKRDKEGKQALPKDKLVSFYSLIIDYFEGDNLLLLRTITGEYGPDETIDAFLDLKEKKPLSYCQDIVDAMQFLIDKVESCNYEDKKEVKSLGKMMKRAKKLGMDTEAFEMQVERSELSANVRLFESKDQALPAVIEKLREKKPEKALVLSKLLENKALSLIKEVEAEEENLVRIKDYLNYFDACGINSEEVRDAAKEKFREVKKYFKNKLKGVSGLEDQLGI